MRSKILLISALTVPLMVLACNRQEQSPTAAGPTQEKQAQAPNAPEKMLEGAPPAAGQPSSPDTAPGSSSTPPVPTTPETK